MSTERQTRQEKIDLQLGRAGWAVGSRRLIEEHPVETISGVHEPDVGFRASNEFADYALLEFTIRSLGPSKMLAQFNQRHAFNTGTNP